MAKKVHTKGMSRQVRAKAKARQNRIKRDVAKRTASNNTKVNRMIYSEAIARKNPQLFKFLARSGFESQNGPQMSNKQLVKESASIIRACIYAANRLQLMALVGLDKFGITRDQHVAFENNLHIVFNHMEQLTDASRKTTLDDFDMVAEVTTSMMDIQELLEDINSPEFLEKHKEHFDDMKTKAELLFAAWKERGHNEHDFSALMFSRYMDEISARIEKEKESAQKEQEAVAEEEPTPVVEGE